ncbi:hypothetical protein GGTG_09750 [Gaeumannomyces tritici R3-111a-1]|uniref:Uncharacterized protein n=1 Tax=Gaeumannomyces tritici (strain R3-111a-1) TaxID=644352 RepID=J3P8B6_GAET3|nr:hypothetical protein GGTG_09750 [Gaeumannomyces tritici R3-111a-1]EJT72899.1 hypothetical protein GGTG_09750 [Gaeumannomyces tritici R3-111a-1]
MAAASAMGARVLSEIEETTLDELLASLRSAFNGLSSRDATRVAAETAIGPGVATRGKQSQQQQQQQLKVFPIPALNGLAAKHLRATQAAVVSVSGRQLPLIYLLVATLIAPPHGKTVVVVDLESRFDITRVLECTPYAAAAATTTTTTAAPATAPALARKQHGRCMIGRDRRSSAGEPTRRAQGPRPHRQFRPRANRSPLVAGGVSLSDLAHVHVHRPARGSLVREAVAAAEQHMLYGAHGSGGRGWWGTFVVGGNSAAGVAAAAAGSGGGSAAPLLHGAAPSFSSSSIDVAAGPRGWLRVERAEVGGFGTFSSVEDALRDRERRRRVVDAAGWTATSVWGGFNFHEN